MTQLICLNSSSTVVNWIVADAASAGVDLDGNERDIDAIEEFLDVGGSGRAIVGLGEVMRLFCLREDDGRILVGYARRIPGSN